MGSPWQRRRDGGITSSDREPEGLAKRYGINPETVAKRKSSNRWLTDPPA
jgi:hypothetical protein